jgi:(R)-2-hydroxyacyl-CoA dehydratese activating ATPase
MITAGIDAGSRAIKALVFDTDTNQIIAHGTAEQGVRSNEVAKELFDHLLSSSGLAQEDVGALVATGYARNLISIATSTVTEITCHACGVHHVMPDARTVVEIGGQDSKLLKLDESGSVRDFAMNDRCAAGTGRFLEIVANRLGVELGELGEMSARSKAPAVISSMCVVFAETEIIGLLASGASPEDIVAGVQASIAVRVGTMAGRNPSPPVVFTGGVAMVPGMDKALENALNQPVTIAPHPQMTGALGAAIIAGRLAAK